MNRICFFFATIQPLKRFLSDWTPVWGRAKRKMPCCRGRIRMVPRAEKKKYTEGRRKRADFRKYLGALVRFWKGIRFQFIIHKGLLGSLMVSKLCRLWNTVNYGVLDVLWVDTTAILIVEVDCSPLSITICLESVNRLSQYNKSNSEITYKDCKTSGKSACPLLAPNLHFPGKLDT